MRTILAGLIGGALVGSLLLAEQPAKSDNKEFLYRIQPARLEMLTVGPNQAEQVILKDHFEHLKQLTQQGVVLFAGRTTRDDASAFGIVVFTAESEEAAAQIMNGDPAVKGGVMKAELFPFHTALMQGRPLP